MRRAALALVTILALSLAACDVPRIAASEPPRSASLPTSIVTDGAAIAVAGYGDAVLADKDVPSPFAVACKATPLVPDDYKRALGTDAQHARVKVPQLEQPLYGVLALCDMPEGAKGAASRAYRIQIPSEYVNATEGGRVSVVFEEVDVEGGSGKHPRTSWQLFLSRSPFPGGDGSALDRVGPRAAAASEATGLRAPRIGGATEGSKVGGATEGLTCTEAPGRNGFVFSGNATGAYDRRGRHGVEKSCITTDGR